MTVNRFLPFSALAFVAGIAACARPYETKLVAGPSTLDTTGIEISVEKPWDRPRSSLELCVEVEGRYQFDSEKGIVSPEGGAPASLRVLGPGDAAGRARYKPSGHFIDLRSVCWPFGYGPPEAGEQIVLMSDPPLRVSRVYWMWSEDH